MMRRSLLAFSAGLAGIVTAGCLGGPGSGDDTENSGKATGTDDSEEATERKETEERGTEIEDTATGLKTSFEVHDVDTGILDGWASVAFEDRTVTVSGAILGSNTCYTARLGTVMIEDRTLLVGVESYEDVDENEGCYDAIVGIEYETTVEILGDLPASVRVEHNGEHVTTEQLF